MTIVLKENEWAEQMIKDRSLGKKPSETLRRVARYYMDKGFSRTETRNKLDAFLLQCDPVASLPKWSGALDFATSKASKCHAIDIDSIPITKTEMEKIDGLDGRQIKRLAFTLLCLAKYWKIVIPDGDYWVNNKDSEIMSLANINATIRHQSAMYRELRDLGMIQFSKKIDNTNVKVCFVDVGDTVLNITDFRNIGYQYLMYHGEPYFECRNCGLVTKHKDPKNIRNKRYCSDCASEIHMRQMVNSVMRQRQKEAETCNVNK